MTSKTYCTILFVLPFVLLGCATPSITQVSFDTYQIKTTDSRGVFANYAETKERTLKEAQDFAYSQNKVLIPISVNEKPMRPGQFYSIDYTFRLVNPQFTAVGSSISGDAGDDSSKEDLACKRSGFQVGTPNYVNCRRQIEANKVEVMRQQAANERVQVQQGRDETAANVGAVVGGIAEIAGAVLLGAAVGAGAASAPRSAPSVVAPYTIDQTIINGRIWNCTTTGPFRNCN